MDLAGHLRAALAIIEPEDTNTPGTGDLVYGGLVKAFEEDRFTLGVAYPAASLGTMGKGADGKVDVIRDPRVLERAAWGWMLKTASAGAFHYNGAGGGEPIDDCVQVVESFIWRWDDLLTKAADGTETRVPTGSWMVGGLWTPEAWDGLVKSRLVTGWSPEGRAKRRRLTPGEVEELRHR